MVEGADVDVAVNITPDLTATMRGAKDVKILVGQSLDNIYMGVTVDPALHPAFAKKEVRQALRHAVDRAGLVGLANGRAVIGPGLFDRRPRFGDPDRRRQAQL
jgi:ABC-type transport system substrate-binding protein